MVFYCHCRLCNAVIHAQTHSARLPCFSDGVKSTDNAGRVPFVPVAVLNSALRILIKYYVTSYNLKFPDKVTPLSPADWEDYVVFSPFAINGADAKTEVM